MSGVPVDDFLKGFFCEASMVGAGASTGIVDSAATFTDSAATTAGASTGFSAETAGVVVEIVVGSADDVVSGGG